MHDLGNVINRVDHSQSGALMTFYLLNKMGIPAEDIATAVTALSLAACGATKDEAPAVRKDK